MCVCTMSVARLLYYNGSFLEVIFLIIRDCGSNLYVGMGVVEMF